MLGCSIALSDDEQSHDGFWEWLDHTIEDIFTEVDRMIALDSVEQQASDGPHRASVRRQDTNEHFESCNIPGGVDLSNETDVLRRPQHEDEYWSVSPTAWSQTSHSRRAILSHVGRINETPAGEEAANGDCEKCAKDGSECMVYRNTSHGAKATTQDLACSLCRFRRVTCSFTTVDRSTTNSRRAVKFSAAKVRRSRKARRSGKSG